LQPTGQNEQNSKDLVNNANSFDKSAMEELDAQAKEGFLAAEDLLSRQ
jgi:hypothetical protein